MSNPEHNSARRMPILSITVQSTSASYLPTSACLSRPTKTLHFKSSFFALTRPRRSLRGATRRRASPPEKSKTKNITAGVRRKGRRAQGTHGPKGRAPKGAEREAPKAPSVPADVLRGTGFRAHKPTSPAQAQHKPSTSPGTSPEETNSFTYRKNHFNFYFFFLN